MVEPPRALPFLPYGQDLTRARRRAQTADWPGRMAALGMAYSKVCASLHKANTKKRFKKEIRAKFGKTWGKKAERYGVPYERIALSVVFERDGWQCKRCGIATPRNKKGTQCNEAPTLDHIVPISKGGPHLYSNVQCLCRACNTRKGTKMETAGVPYPRGGKSLIFQGNAGTVPSCRL